MIKTVIFDLDDTVTKADVEKTMKRQVIESAELGIIQEIKTKF